MDISLPEPLSTIMINDLLINVELADRPEKKAQGLSGGAREIFQDLLKRQVQIDKIIPINLFK